MRSPVAAINREHVLVVIVAPLGNPVLVDSRRLLTWILTTFSR